MKAVASLKAWWRGFWARRLGWTSDPFLLVLGDLNDRVLIIEKRCEALTPSAWVYRGEQ